MTKEEKLAVLEKCVNESHSLAGLRVQDALVLKWKRDTEVAIEHIFGAQSRNLQDFRRISFVPISVGGFGAARRGVNVLGLYQSSFANGLEQARAVLASMCDEIRTFSIDDSPASSAAAAPTDVWVLLHPSVVKVARSRFESGHLADAVEAALKELNNAVKLAVRQATGKELDGAGLMTTAFSPNNPILKLDDLSTTSGRDAQQGYIQIYAGTMTGIRNPKAHDNVQIDSSRALHLLFLASLLMSKLDEAS